MSLFEKIEFERIEPEEPGDIPQSSRQWADKTLTVVYQPWKKAMVLLFPLFLLPIFQAFLEEGFFAFEVLAVLAVVIGVWYCSDFLITRDFSFSPDRIVKRGVFGQTVLPANALVMTVDDQNIRLFHGTEKNIRESVKIRRFLITTEESADIQKYAEDIYHVSANTRKRGDSAEGKTRTNKLATIEFHKSVSTYRTMAAFFVIYALIAVFTVGLSESFFGLAPSLSAYPARLVCICLAIAGFFLLRRLASTYTHGDNISSVPVTTRLQKADRYAFMSAIVASGVACLGLVLFLLFGNMLDFYLFLLVGVLYFFDYYPRLSTWERTVSGKASTESGSEERVILPRRSLQVSLVLMGALSVLSYGESRHYLYNSRQDCLNDWGDGKDCQEAPTGSTSYGTRHYYGPRYGSGGGRPARSVGVATVSRGGFGSLGSFHASFGG